MKKAFTIVLACIMIVGLCSCGGGVSKVTIQKYGGDVSKVAIQKYESDLYTEKEISSAINVVIKYFENDFSGCTLTEITYAGDEESIRETEYYAEDANADEVIVLVSSFDVDSSGGDGSLTPNSTYSDWKWILVRNKGGEWKYFTHGYA